MNRLASRPRLWALVLLLVAACLPFTSLHAVGAPKPAPSKTPASAPSAAPEASPAATPAPEPSPTPSGGGDDRSEAISQAAQAMGTIQSFLEFYFMETGQYPDALEDMLSQYNQGVKQNEPLVKIPTDPATGKKFVYAPNGDRSKYTLKVPEPAAYGLVAYGVHQIDWGWMAGIAEEQKKRRMTIRCGQYMQLIADVCEQFNKANRNHFPDTLEQLIPKFLQKIPTCPLSKKPYNYRHTDRGFEVLCPDPKAHGLDELRFSSTEGLKKFP